MTTTPILSMPQVAANQNQKETTINSALAILEAACNDNGAFNLATGNLSMVVADFTRHFHLVFSGQTAARTVTFPATVRFFAVSNTGTFNLTLKTSAAGGATLTVEPSKRVLVISNGTDLVAISAGIDLLASLSDVVGAADASAGQLLAFDGTSSTWGPVDSVCDVSFFAAGVPTANQVVHHYIFTRSARLFSDFNGSQAKAGVAATANSTFSVYKNGVLAGVLSIAAGATAVTFSTDTGSGSTSVTFAPTDILTVKAQATPDATLADVVATLKGVYL